MSRQSRESRPQSIVTQTPEVTSGDSSSIPSEVTETTETHSRHACAVRVTLVVLCVYPLLILRLSGMLRQRKDTRDLHVTLSQNQMFVCSLDHRYSTVRCYLARVGHFVLQH